MGTFTDLELEIIERSVEHLSTKGLHPKYSCIVLKDTHRNITGDDYDIHLPLVQEYGEFFGKDYESNWGDLTKRARLMLLTTFYVLGREGIYEN